MTLQERLTALDTEIATWRQRVQQAQAQLIARQGQRELLVELLEESPESAPQLLRQAAK